MEFLPKDMIPVQAKMETTTKWPSGGSASSADFSRDEKSRTRIDHGDMASVTDPVHGKSFLLNVPKKLAMPTAPTVPAAPAVPKAQMVKPKLPQFAMPTATAPKPPEDLGKKVINGIPVEGKRYETPVAGQAKPMTTEIWHSKELELPIHSSVHDPATGRTTVTEMKHVVPGAKLDPSKFEVPKDFKIVKRPS